MTIANNNFNESRTFGVELEIISKVPAQTVASNITAATGIYVTSEGYNHSTRSHWKLTTDSSIRTRGEHRYAMELVSPVLKGTEGLEEVRKIAAYLVKLSKYAVNESCGFHVHHGVADWDVKNFKNLLVFYKRFESTIDKMTRASQWCQSNAATVAQLREGNHRTVEEVVHTDNDRYKKVNFRSFVRQSTVEFRQHQGTKSPTSIVNWIVLTQAMVEKCTTGRVQYKEGAEDWFNMKKVLRLYKWMGADEKQLAAVKHFNKVLKEAPN